MSVTVGSAPEVAVLPPGPEVGLGPAGRRRLAVLGVGGFVAALGAAFVVPLAGAALFLVPVAVAVLLRSRADAAALASVYAAVLFLVPARLTLPAMGGIATPANALAIGFAALWGLRRFMPDTPAARRSHPGRIALLAFAWTSGLALCVAFLRPLLPLESSSAQKGMIQAVAMAGLGLFVGDGVRSRERLDVLLRRVAALVAVVAAIGILAFFTGFDFGSRINVPGLSSDEAAHPIEMRSNFRRVASTTEHPIEFGLVLAMGLPLAVHHLRHATGRSRRRWMVATALIGLALPMSVSRTAALAGFVGAAVILPTWPRRERRIALRAAVVGAVLMKLMVPGLLGTIRALFLHANTDSSVSGRTMDYTLVSRYFFRSPVFGRGLNTFEPSLYDFLDNQFLKTALEGGVVLLLALVAAIVTAVLAARAVRKASDDERTRDLCQCLTASILMALVSFATFDLLSFDIAIGLMFLLMGAAIALRRIHHLDLAARTAPTGG